MRSTTVILESFTDDSTGTLGLAIKGMRRDENTNSATDGLMIAHDLLEHVNGVEQIGDIADEMQALGAMWYVRGQFDDLRRDGIGGRWTPYQHMSSDFVRMFRDHVEGDQYLDLRVPRTRPCVADDDFREIIACAAKDWAGEFNEPDKGKSAWPKYARLALAQMRIGHRKIARKYKDAHTANRLFWRVADAVLPYAKNCEAEGAEFKLEYGVRADGSVFAYCEEYYDGFDYR